MLLLVELYCRVGIQLYFPTAGYKSFSCIDSHTDITLNIYETKKDGRQHSLQRNIFEVTQKCGKILHQLVSKDASPGITIDFNVNVFG